jgi:predicted small integral membrane protein
MILVRYCKIALVASVALYATFVVFNNVTDYGSNFAFVQHVLMMDTIFSDTRQTWRAIGLPVLHHAAYIAIILVQAMVAFLCWAGATALGKAVRQDEPAFHRAKNMAIAGLTLGFCLWFLGFIGIGGEWFLMWQWERWNAQQSAFRIATLIGLVLLFLCLRDPE